MADDYSDDIATRGTLRPGGQASGMIETASDADWFRIALTAGKYYTFELAPTVAGNTRTLDFHDAQGGAVLLGAVYGGGTIAHTIKAGATGDFYVGVRDLGHTGNASAAAYTLTASAGVTDTIGDSRDTAKALTLGEKAAAALEGGIDTDYFKIALQAGVTYAVTTTWSPNGQSGNVRVEDPDGAYVSVNNTSAPSFTAARTGDYYVAVAYGYGAMPNYAITVTQPADDHTASVAGAGLLTVDAPATQGTFETVGDLDWYGVQLVANTTYWFTLQPGGAPGYNGYGMLKMLAADGTVVATGTSNYVDAGSSVLLQYVPTTSGRYYLEAAGTSGYGTGNYAVRAAIGEADEYGDTQATAATIAVGGKVDGKLTVMQDVDVFRLAVTAGKTYLVELTARALDGASELALGGQPANYGGTDQLIEYARTGVAEYRVLTATTTGDYYLTVGTAWNRGTGSYALAVSEAPADDYASGRNTTGVLAVGGKASGQLDYTGDSDTFKVTLQYGAKYAFQLRGAGSGEGTLPLGGTVQLHIAGPDGMGSAYLNNNGDGTYTFTTTSGGDYYLSVSPQYFYQGGPTELTGSYTVHAVALNGDTSAPTLLSHAPAANAGPLDDITLRFSEAIMRGSGISGSIITLRDSLGVMIESYYQGDNRVTISGDTLTIDPSVQLKPGAKYLLDVPEGSVVDLAGNKFGGNAPLPIDTIATVATGGGGNDYLVGLGTGAKLSGAGGVDTALYGYERGAYEVVRGAGGTTTVKKIWDNAAGNADLLDGVERLMFANVNVALDIDGVSGQAFRLYQAAFDRAPDKAGLGYWIDKMDHGLSLQGAARGFLNSPEFTTLYGASPSDTLFVNQLYQNVLHRAPDEGGLQYWLAALRGGMDRAGVLVGFSESPENQAAIVQVIGNGFDYTPYG